MAPHITSPAWGTQRSDPGAVLASGRGSRASPPAAHLLLARDGDQLAGLAAYSFLWPASGLTRSLYLKELYVAGRHRGRGAGKLGPGHRRRLPALRLTGPQHAS